jgi:hypothetical protein
MIEIASHRHLAVRISAGPKEKAKRELLVFHNGFEQRYVKRILEPRVCAIASKPSVKRLVDGVGEMADQLSALRVIKASSPEPIDEVGLVALKDVVGLDFRGIGAPLEKQVEDSVVPHLECLVEH